MVKLPPAASMAAPMPASSSCSVAGRLELPGRYAGAAADVEHVAPGAGGDDLVGQGAWVAGPGPVVALGLRAEGLGYLAGLVYLIRL
jgi:hypothetical protein